MTGAEGVGDYFRPDHQHKRAEGDQSSTWLAANICAKRASILKKSRKAESRLSAVHPQLSQAHKIAEVWSGRNTTKICGRSRHRKGEDSSPFDSPNRLGQTSSQDVKGEICHA